MGGRMLYLGLDVVSSPVENPGSSGNFGIELAKCITFLFVCAYSENLMLTLHH
jgi:hypothetical protein